MKKLNLNKKISQLACLLVASSCLLGAQGMAMAQTAGNASKSPSLARLDADSAQLNADMTALHARLQDVHKTLWLTKNLLAVPGHVASDLRKLEAELKMLDGLLNTAQAVPQIRENAKRAKQEVDVALKEVTAAKLKSEQAEHRVEPFKTRINAADERIVKLDANAERFRMAVPYPMSSYTGVAQTCVNNAAAARKQCMQGIVDGKGGNLDKGIQQMDKVVKLALTNMPDLTNLKQLDDDFEVLESIRKKIEGVIKVTESMMGPLKELDSLLGRHFKASFPYPDPTWKNPVRISHYDVKVSMRTILNGGKAIEDEIERMLSKSLWKAAKIFGVGKLVDSIKHEAEHELKKITGKLHLNPNLRIPELDRLNNVFGIIDADIAKFPADFGMKLPDISIDAPSLNYGGQIIDLNAIKRLTGDLAPHGISGAPASLCAGVSYGCQ